MKKSSCSRIFSLHALLFALLALLAPSARAQANQSGGHMVASPSCASCPFDGIASGDMDANLSPEIAVVRDGSLIILHNPDANDDSVVVATDVLDVCYLPDVIGAGQPGFLYTSNSTGLRLATFDFETNAYRTDAIINPPPEAQGAWLIRYAPDLGLDKVFFVSIHPIYGQTFYSAIASANGFYAATDLFHMNPTARDLVLLDYDDTTVEGTPDIGIDLGILHSNGLHIRSQRGSFFLARAVVANAIAAVHREDEEQGQGIGDCLALVAQIPVLESALVLFAPELTGTGGTYTFPTWGLPATYTSAAAADTNGDGFDDLALGRSDGQIDVFLQDEVGLFEAGASLPSIYMSAPGAVETSMGRILWANLFNDRDSSGALVPSFAAGLPSADGVRLAPGFEARIYGIENDPEDVPRDFVNVNHRSTLRDDTTEFCLSTAQPAKWTVKLGDGWGPTNANAIEMIVRRQRPGASDVDPLAFHHYVFPISQGAIENFPFEFLTTSTHDGGIPSGLEEDSAEKYFVQVRPILVNAPFQTVAWRWSVLSLSAHCCALDALRSLLWHLSPEVPICEIRSCSDSVLDCDESAGDCSNASVIVPSCIPGTEQIGGRIIPSAVPQSRVPTSGPNGLPIIYPPEE